MWRFDLEELDRAFEASFPESTAMLHFACCLWHISRYRTIIPQ
jgi:hypothetical protein